MAIAADEKITDVDFNLLINNLNTVYSTGTGNSGYGTTALPLVVAGTNKIKSLDWANLHIAITTTATHQDTSITLPNIIDLESGDVIKAYTDFTTAITSITTNKLNVDVTQTTSDSSVLTSQRTADWSNEIQHVFTVDFTTDDAARNFFNTGGQITLDMDAPLTDSAHQWGVLYNEAQSPFIFDHLSYFAISSTINVSTTLATFISSGSAYGTGDASSSNKWVISAKFVAGTSTNGARGSKIELTSKSIDSYTGNPSFPGSPDIVTGTFDSTIGERRSTSSFPITQPTYATVIDLTNGS